MKDNKQGSYRVMPRKMAEEDNYHKGRGAQVNTKNRFLKDQHVKEHVEGIDDWTESQQPTQYMEQEAKSW
jgi:hypothetical protein